MIQKYLRLTLLLSLFLPLILSSCGAAAPETITVVETVVVEKEIVEVVTDREVEAAMPAAIVSEDAIREFIHHANAQYAAALETVEFERLEATWHGVGRELVGRQVERLATEGLFRISDWEIEVVTVYPVADDYAIAKTIETWTFEELDIETKDVRRADSAGPLYETYYVEFIDDRWSVARLEILETPALTLTGLQGQVFVNGLQVTEDREIVPGDEIRTDFGSSAVLLYPFDSTSEIREDSHLILTGLRVESDAGHPAPRVHAEFELIGSDVWNRLTSWVKSLFSFSSATAEDHPSEFGVSVEDGRLVVRVKEGEATLTSGGRTVTVRSGQQSSATPGRAPEEPRRWSAIEEQGAADLVAFIGGPPSARPGQDIGSQITIEVSNIGDKSAFGTEEVEDGYMIDLVLSSDDFLPITFAAFSPNFSEDVLLQGGRISRTSTLGPKESMVATARAIIPEDTPPGVYCIGVVVDPNNTVSEAIEANNTACHWVEIIAPPVAEFIAEPREGVCEFTVEFINQSRNAERFFWNFGDGATSDERDPVHTYDRSEGGRLGYTVTLLVEGPGGQDEETKVDYIVSPGCLK